MKKSLLALAVLGACATAAHAQTSVTIYGDVDLAVKYKSNTSTATAVNPTTKTTIGGGDNSRLGFKGTEDLGGGLKALFQLEMRYDADTGAVEGNTRPLFQGESRVGLQGDFGMVRIGRGLTPMQATSAAFEPWAWMPNRIGGFATDVFVAGYNSDPLGVVNNSKNRFSNGLFYNSPVFSGFQFNIAATTKEGSANGYTGTQNGATIGSAVSATGSGTGVIYLPGAQPSATPFSATATYTNGPAAAYIAYERNAVETKYAAVGASFNVIPDLKLMANYSRQDQSHTVIAAFDKTTAWLIGANYTVGSGKILAGYGQKRPDGWATTKQASIGYEHNLSKRTFLYVDAMNKKDSLSATVSPNYNAFDFGIHHNF